MTQLVETVRGNDMYMLKAEVLLLTVWVRIAPLPSRPAVLMRLTGVVLELLVVLAETVTGVITFWASAGVRLPAANASSAKHRPATDSKEDKEECDFIYLVVSDLWDIKRSLSGNCILVYHANAGVAHCAHCITTRKKRGSGLGTKV